MIEKVKRFVTVYWLPVSATLVFQGLAIRYVAEVRGHMAVGGEALAIPAMYLVYIVMRGLPSFVLEMKELMYGYER